MSLSVHQTQGVDNGLSVIVTLITWLKFLHCKVTVFSFCNMCLVGVGLCCNVPNPVYLQESSKTDGLFLF